MRPCHSRPTAVDDLRSDPRGSGVLLPPGFVEETRVTASDRSYKVIWAPDGTRCQSRLEAWRHYAVVESRAFRESLTGGYEFDPPSDGSDVSDDGSPPAARARRPAPGSAPARPGVSSRAGSSTRPPSPGPSASPSLAQPTEGVRGTRRTLAAGQPAAVGLRPKVGRGSRLRANLR